MRWNSRSTYSGGGLGIGPGLLSPFIKAMLLVNTALFIASYFLPKLSFYLGLTPALFFSQFPNYIWQPFTYMFMHDGLGHIFFNMFALWMFGTEIELTWGTRTFGRFYVLAGLAGALLTMIVHYDQTIPMVGASGAIYAILIAYWLMFPDRQLYIYFLFPVKVKYAIPGLMIIGFFFGGARVAHMAHLGGALFAIAYLKLDWRWLAIGRKLKNLRYRRQEAKLNKRRQEAEDIMKKVDAILDKINEVGLENLTKAERKFLEDASSILQKQKEHRER